MSGIRQPAVAGSFYQKQAKYLQNEVDMMLTAAQQQPSSAVADIPPKAIIVPHAGYVYSGPTAATAYARLKSVSGIIRRVVLLGPVHRVAVRGLALPAESSFATPLGEVEIDKQASETIRHLPQVVVFSEAHEYEHSLEVQLPFLQTVLEDFKIIPLAVGDATAEEVAEVLELLWGGPETLIVISSDLSHFLPYEQAVSVDTDTVQKILDLDGPLGHQQACGGTPVNGLLLAAEKHHLQTQLLDICNSGDSSGDKSRVVGYAAIALNEAS